MLLDVQALAQPWCPCLSRANTALDKTQKWNGSGKRRAEPSFPKLPLRTLQMSFCGQVEDKSSTMWEKISTSPGERGVYSREHPASIVLAGGTQQEGHQDTHSTWGPREGSPAINTL